MNPPKNNFWLAVGVVGLDQLTKLLVRRESVFKIRVIQNPGLPFGIHLPGFFDTLVVAIVLAVFVSLYFRYFSRPRLRVGFVLIVSGAASNLVDRFLHGSVTDFINFGISTLNFADLAIVAGIGVLLLAN
jgi:signal peptidase II